MCARSILSASLGSFILFNKAKLGSHFTSLSVLLCLIQIEIIGGAQAPPLPTALNRTEMIRHPVPVQVFVATSSISKSFKWFFGYIVRRLRVPVNTFLVCELVLTFFFSILFYSFYEKCLPAILQ